MSSVDTVNARHEVSHYVKHNGEIARIAEVRLTLEEGSDSYFPEAELDQGEDPSSKVVYVEQSAWQLHSSELLDIQQETVQEAKVVQVQKDFFALTY